jgi:YVTN family beta-propeller protein
MKRIVDIRLLSSFVVATLAATALVRSQSLELKPGYIAGTVTLGGETINQTDVNATWQSQSSSSSQSSSAYNLTVNVPSGTSPVYSVRPTVYTDSRVDYLQMPSQSVAVAENQTSTLNFNLAPAYISGTINATNGTLQYAYIYANSALGDWYAYTSTNPNPDRNSRFRFPVIPGVVRAWATVYFTNGTSFSVPTQSLGTLTPGGEVTFDINAVAPSTDGAVNGTVTVSGSRVTSQRQVYVSGPVFRSATPSLSGSYEASQLPAGSYNVYANLWYNGGRFYRSAYGSPVTGNPPVSISGNFVTRDFDIRQSYITGTFGLTGTRTLAQSNLAYVYVNGQYNTSTQWAYGQAEVTRPSGDFELIVSPGTWVMNSSHYLSFFDQTSGQYLNGYLSVYDYQNAASPITVAEGDTATRNLTYETGTVKIVLRSSGAVTFGSPRLQLDCRNDVNGQIQTYWNGNFYGNQMNVTSAPVTMVGIKGRCTVFAYGRITGASGETLFGQTQVDVVPGSDLTLDIGGPTLTVLSPVANTAFSAGPVVVTGKVTDDVQVSSVSVNGVSAALTSGGNPNDPREVSFTVSVPLTPGANQIATIAADNSGKTAADTRTVYLDNQDPVVSWAPADGTTYQTPGNVTISGTATDNLGISTITVNGAVVYTTSGTAQTSVNFSKVLNLAGGTHTIVVVVKDLGNRTVSQSRTVTVIAPETTTTVTTSPKPSVSGQLVTFTATVTPKGGPALGMPTGTVQFKVDGVNFGNPLFLSSGSASMSTSSLAVGSREIAAVYSGSGTFVGSSGTASHTVDKVTTTTALASAVNPSKYGQSVMLTATVTAVAPGAGIPSGTVQFKQNGANIGSAVSLSATGTASLSVSTLSAGAITIVAEYSGNQNYDGSAGTLMQTVSPATPTLTWNNPTSIPYRTALSGAQLNATANVPGAFAYTPTSGTVLPVGTHSLSVTFTPESANYTSTTATVTLVVMDSTPPTIEITAPAPGALVALNADLTAAFACADGESGVSDCDGTVANGAALDTSTPGVRTFIVTTRDAAGNTATREVTYTVAAVTAIPQTFVYLAEFRGGQIAVYDGSTNALVRKMRVGDGPLGMAFDPDGTRLNVAEYHGNSVATLDPITGALLNRYPVGSSPWAVAPTLDATRLYVANIGDGTVSIISRATGATTTVGTGDSGPAAVLATADGRHMLVGNGLGHTISVFDTATDAIVHTIDIKTTVDGREIYYQPMHLALSPDGTRILAVSPAGRRIFVIDPATFAVTNSFDAGQDNTEWVAFSPDGAEIYLTTSGPGSPVKRLDAFTGQIIGTLDAGGYPGAVAVAPHGLRAFVPSSGSNRLHVLDPVSNQRITSVETSGGPARVIIAPLATEMQLEAVPETYRTTQLRAMLSSGTGAIAGRPVEFRYQDTVLGSAVTDAAGEARLTIDSSGLPGSSTQVMEVTAIFRGDSFYLSTTQAAPLPLDIEPPAIAGVADIVAEASSAQGASVAFATPPVFDADPEPQVSASHASGSYFPIGQTMVVVTASDAAGNSSSASFTITVVDTIPPALQVPPDIRVEALGPSGAVATWPATATDVVDGQVAVSCSPASGSAFPFGTSPVTCSATDAAGNISAASFTITVIDTTPPALQVPGNITVEATGPSGAPATWSATATDLVGQVTVSCSPASGATFRVGTSPVNCTATDGAGNTSTASFTITVIDTTPPALQLPGNITVEATGPSGALAAWSATAVDLVDRSVTVSCLPASGSVFGITTTAVSCSGRDAHGNTATGTFSVTVRDTTPPTLSPVVSPNPVLLYGTATVDPRAADATSGLASQSCGALVTNSVGAKSVTCTATDKAGNTNTVSASYSVIYLWTGFFQPVDNVPTLNVVKAGSAIPVKFGLGGDQGLSIFAAGNPLSRAITCDTFAPVDDIEQIVTSAGGSSLSYDPVSGQYIYVWKTDKAWALTCRQLVLKLVDGTEHVANFKLK